MEQLIANYEDMMTKIKRNNIMNTARKELVNLDFSSQEEAICCKDNIAQNLEKMGIIKHNNIQYYKGIYNIFIELIENIHKHNQISPYNKAKFAISREGENFLLKVNSFCKKEDFNNLSNVNTLNGLDLNNITELFRIQSNNGEMSDKGGAGLGNLKIARIIRNMAPYNNLDITNKNKIFYLRGGKEINDLIETQLIIKIPTLHNIARKIYSQFSQFISYFFIAFAFNSLGIFSIAYLSAVLGILDLLCIT